MARSKEEALLEIRQGICGCFEDVGLRFAANVSGQARANQLRSIGKTWALRENEIEFAIRPSIREWLDNGFIPFGESTPRPWHEDADQRRMKAGSMTIEAASYLSRR
jgi:hypothetical protein